MKKTNGNRPQSAPASRAPRPNAKPAPVRPADRIETDDLIDFDEYNLPENIRDRRRYAAAGTEFRHIPKTGLKAVSWFFGFVFLALSALLCIVLYRYNILPNTLRLVTAGILLVINLISFSLLIAGLRRKSFIRTALILSVVFSLILGAGNYYLVRGVMALSEISTRKNVRTTDMSVVVLKNSPIQKVDELIGKTTLAPVKTDQTSITAYLADIQTRTGVLLETTDVPTYIDAADGLYQGDGDAMVMTTSWLEDIRQSHPNFSEETRVIDSSNLVKEVKDVVKDVDTETTGFNIYISGIDTYGEISSVSRSDVNIIMTVNPNTRKMLLTSVPRDTYLPIAGGGMGEYDKLTHAGIYGVESSIETLENFLETDINYYARVNFTSLIEMVDLIGGVDVENPTAFSTDEFNFPEGSIHLNGDEALAFSRERYNLAGGDFDRGRNQERVIIAIFNKLTSPELLKNYNSILSAMSQSIQTNMPTEAIMGLANSMIENQQPWETEMTDVKGTGQPGLSSYLIPGREIYMMVPYEDSVAEVKEMIRNALKGE